MSLCLSSIILSFTIIIQYHTSYISTWHNAKRSHKGRASNLAIPHLWLNRHAKWLIGWTGCLLTMPCQREPLCVVRSAAGPASKLACLTCDNLSMVYVKCYEWWVASFQVDSSNAFKWIAHTYTIDIDMDMWHRHRLLDCTDIGTVTKSWVMSLE